MDRERKFDLRSEESKQLGEQFLGICDSYGLPDTDITLIDSVLSQFSSLNGNIFAKLRKMQEAVGESPRKEDIFAAMTEISHTAVMTHPFNPYGKKAENFPFN